MVKRCRTRLNEKRVGFVMMSWGTFWKMKMCFLPTLSGAKLSSRVSLGCAAPETAAPRTVRCGKAPCVPERPCSAPRSGLGRRSGAAQQTPFLISSLP